MRAPAAPSFMVLLAALAGPGGTGDSAGVAYAAPDDPPKVLESFVVGAEVYVRSLAVDRSDESLWVGTSTGVLEIGLREHELRNTFTREHGLANEYVFAIHVDSAGHKWFGTNAGGVSRYKNGDWRVLFPMHGLADYWVYAFAQQDKGPLWIGTWAGANRVDPQTLKFETFVEELINEWVYGIGVDAQDRVWFGTEGGVSMFDGVRWRHWTHADGLGAPNVQQRPASPNTGLGTRDRHDAAAGRRNLQPQLRLLSGRSARPTRLGGYLGWRRRQLRWHDLAQLHGAGRTCGKHRLQHRGR